MISINSVNSGSGPSGASPLQPGRESYPAGLRANAAASIDTDRSDRVELSEAARALAASPTPIREDLVARIRAQIADGTYDVDSRIDSAISELAKDLNPINLDRAPKSPSSLGSGGSLYA